MPASLKEFQIELFEEHLEESSFLYEQRKELLNDPEISWLDIGDFENRLDAHVDALAVGGDLAAKVCVRKSLEGDFGELHAAARALCGQKRLAEIKTVVEGADLEDHEKFEAVGDALSFDMPENWFPGLEKTLAEKSFAHRRLLARVAGYRRIREAKAIIGGFLEENDGELMLTTLWAMGRIRTKEFSPKIYGLLRHGDQQIRRNAAMALLRTGEPPTSIEKHTPPENRDSLILPLGLRGDRTKVPTLIDKLPNCDDPVSAVLALGTIGDMAAAEPLLELLSDPDLAEYASLSLNLFTGAQLRQEIHIPEEIDPDELFEGETATDYANKTAQADDAPASGGTKEILCRDSGPWRDWWERNRKRFSPDVCYRNGKPFSPACLLENLTDANTPRIIREIAYEEMAIRYGIDFAFETDMPVKKQVKALSLLRAAIES